MEKSRARWEIILLQLTSGKVRKSPLQTSRPRPRSPGGHLETCTLGMPSRYREERRTGTPEYRSSDETGYGEVVDVRFS